MKIKSIIFAAFCTAVVGGVANVIVEPHTANAQIYRNQTRTEVLEAEAVLIDRDPNARINIRTEPSWRSRVRGYGLVGDRVEILQEIQSREGQMWYEVEFIDSGEIGWIPGDNLRVADGGSGREESIRLSQRGQGSFQISGRPDWDIALVTVNIDERDRAELAFRLDDNRLIRLSGDLDRRDAYRLTIDIEGSGNANASGTVDIEYGANNSINQIFGDGRLDGQPFSISFDGDRTAGSSNDLTQEFLGEDINAVVRRLRSQGWMVVETDPGAIKLDRGRSGIDLEFNPRTRRVTSVRRID